MSGATNPNKRLGDFIQSFVIGLNLRAAIFISGSGGIITQ